MAQPPNPDQAWKIAPVLLERFPPRLPDGQIDYFNLEPAHLVVPGDKIAVLAQAGDASWLTAGTGCSQSSDGSSLVATLHGLPEARNGTIFVRPFRIIGECTGSEPVLFPGGVTILGDVKGTP